MSETNKGELTLSPAEVMDIIYQNISADCKTTYRITFDGDGKTAEIIFFNPLTSQAFVVSAREIED